MRPLEREPELGGDGSLGQREMWEESNQKPSSISAVGQLRGLSCVSFLEEGSGQCIYHSMYRRHVMHPHLTEKRTKRKRHIQDHY